MLSKRFFILVLVANLLALPIAWWTMQKWLQNFTYHVNISFVIIAQAIIVSLMITLSALGYQIIKAALGNPVQALRRE